MARAGELTDEQRLAGTAAVAKALSDPIRLRMLEVMARGRSCCELVEPADRGVPGRRPPTGLCVCEMQEQFGLAQSRASYHLRVLRDAGLVVEETRGKWTFYTIDRETASQALRQLAELLGA